MLFQKVEQVEARQYSGPKFVVMNDEKGEQTCNDGDYLVGCERGKVFVIAKAEFEKNFAEHTPTSDEEKIAAQAGQISDLEKQASALQAEKESAGLSLASLSAENASLKSEKNDFEALKSENSSMRSQLEAALAEKADVEGKLAKLAEAEKAREDAQAAIEKSQSAVHDTLNG